jgi:ribosomal protein S18 acetylase RimI-like enzyme
VDEIAYMRRSLNPEEFSEDEIVLPEGFDNMPLIDANEGALYDCYNRAFIESGVRVYQDMTEEERHNDFEHYFKARNRNEEASMVVVRDGEILGFSLVHSRPREAHLADIGIVPAHRGKGLGKKIMKHSLMKAAKEYDTMTLAVDVDNTSAYELFGDFGFEVDYRIITHAWKKVFKLDNN